MPAHPEELKKSPGADAGSIGPIGFNGRIIADNRLKDANNLYSGANENDYHLGGIDLKRDLPTGQAGVKNIEYFDLRSAQSGEECIKCGNKLDVFSAIELGHIFKLGTKYSASMGAKFLDENGKEQPIIMGSYGIGVERVMACYIEQHNDEYGLVWDKTLAPFHVPPYGAEYEKTGSCKRNKLYDELTSAGIEVLFDDSIDAQAGFKFKDADLLGMPVQIIVGDKKLKDLKVEVKIRNTGERFDVDLNQVLEKIPDFLG